MRAQTDPARRCLPVADWPDGDRLAWHAALAAGDPLSCERSTAASWKPATSHKSRRGYGRWALEKKEGGGLIGYCGLAHGIEEVGVEVVYLLAREEWGEGIATEAAGALVEYAFSTLGLPRVVAVVYPDNLASRRILETLGFASDGPCEYKGARVERYVLDAGAWRASS